MLSPLLSLFLRSSLIQSVVLLVQLEHGHLLLRPEVAADSSSLVHLGMLAAPINPSDLGQVQGTYPLKSHGDVHVGGNEGAAVVLAVGEAVRGLSPGDWVIPKVGAFGTWREQVVCLEDDLQKIPRDIPLSVAATLKVNPPTAYRLLRDFCPLKQGSRSHRSSPPLTTIIRRRCHTEWRQ